MRQNLRTITTVVALLAAVAVFAPAGAGAAPQGAAPPEVSAAAQGAGTNRYVACSGKETTLGGEGQIQVSRGNATSGTLAVAVSYGGTLDPDVDFRTDLPTSITIPAGEQDEVVEIQAIRPGTLTITVDAGDSYTVGTPASATADFFGANGEAICGPVQEETILVGQAPTWLDPESLGIDPASELASLPFRVLSTPPPGITVSANGISGAATTPGTYEWTAAWCRSDTFCAVEIPYRTTVAAADASDPVQPGPAPAAPAAPVSTNATYTG